MPYISAHILLRSRVFDSVGIKIKGGRERKEGKGGGRGGEKEHLPFISIAYSASSL
jgi:hypothetical protein